MRMTSRAWIAPLLGGLVLTCAGPASAAPHDTTLVSRASAGAKANGASTDGVVSGDGRYVAFASTATNLSPDDGDTVLDIYRRDLAKDRVELVSRASGASGAKAAGSYVGRPSISGDGHVIAFMSDATNLSKDDPDSFWDIFVRDLATGETSLVSRASGSGGVKSNLRASAPAVSADGRFVAFASSATNLVPEQPAQDQVYVRDLQAGTTTLVSRATGAGGAPANRDAQFPSISGDGRYVTFSTAARNLVPGDTNQRHDVFVRDLLTDTTTLVSRSSGKAGAIGGGNSRFGAISSSGRVVALPTTSRLSAADTDTLTDVYVRDIGSSTTTLVSRASGASGAKGDFHSGGAALSGDGRRVAFISSATNLSTADVDGAYDVYVRDTVANTTTLVSRAGGANGVKGNAISDHATTSADGRVVAFDSRATNLSPADPVPDYDQYVRELPVRALLPLGAARAAAVGAPVRRW
jgi:Tol biopolymer transport system component